MKKALSLMFAFALVISMIIIMIHQEKPDSTAAEAIQKAFSETGAVPVSSEIYVRGTSKRKVLNEDDARDLLEDIVNMTGAGYPRDLPAFEHVSNDFVQGIEVNYIIDENKTIHMSVTDEINKKMNSSIAISLIDTSRDPSVLENTAAVKDSFDKWGIEYEANISLMGCLDGKLGDEEIEELYDRAFTSIGANRVEGISDDGLVSVSAFSPSIGEAIRVNGKKVNMNMAARYNTYEEKTYIWLATPVISTEY